MFSTEFRLNLASLKGDKGLTEQQTMIFWRQIKHEHTSVLLTCYTIIRLC